MTPKSKKILDLLQKTNGGVVTFELIYTVVWGPDKSNWPFTFHDRIAEIKKATKLRIRRHHGIGYQIDPVQDECCRAKNNSTPPEYPLSDRHLDTLS